MPAFEYREPFFTEAWDKDWAANRTNGDHTQLDSSTAASCSITRSSTHSRSWCRPRSISRIIPSTFL